MNIESIKKRVPSLKWIYFCLLMYPAFTWAQTEEVFISEVKLMNVVEVEMTVKDSLYMVRFRDVNKKRFAKYKTFRFPHDKTYYSQLKDAVLSGFDSLPEEPRVLDFTKEKVELQFRQSFGLTSFRFVLAEGKKEKRYFSSWFVKGKAEKIFGM